MANAARASESPPLSEEIHASLVADRLSENLTETFDNMRANIELYERGEISFKSLLRSLRVSMDVLDGRKVKRV